MTTVTPPPGPTPPGPTPSGPTAPVATVTASPEVLKKLEALKILEAQVAAMTARTQALLDTPAGQVAVRLPPALQVVDGARLTLQLTALADDQVQARVTAVDGRPTVSVQPGGAGAALPPSAVQQGVAEAAVPVRWAVSARPAGLPALVVQGPRVEGGAAGAGQAPWAVGTQLTVRLAAVQPPGAAVPTTGATAPVATAVPTAVPGVATPTALPAIPAAGASSPTPSGPIQGQPPPAALPPSPPQGQPAGLPQGPAQQPIGGAPQAHPGAEAPRAGAPTAMSGAAASAQPQATLTTSTASALSAGQAAPQASTTATTPAAQPVLATLTGTVAPQAGTTPLIVTPAGTVSLQTAVPLPAGTTVVLEVTAAQPPPAPSPGVPPLPGGGPMGAAVAQAMAVLTAEDPQAARRMMAALPAADARMLTNVVAVSQAAAAGGSAGVRAWAGPEPVRALEKAGPRGAEALRGLSEGLREATTLVRDTGGGEWRALTMPFAVGGAIERIQIVTRRHPGDVEDGEEDGAGGGKGGGGQRFLIHLDLSRLGAMQLDGLYKKRHRRLDLIVRTHEALPRAMQRDLAGLFATSAQALGLKGGLSFHVSERFAGPDLEPDGPGAGLMV